ncbi:hypothetical protein ACEPAI_9672 [Sanghuangporus weigelae]
MMSTADKHIAGPESTTTSQSMDNKHPPSPSPQHPVAQERMPGAYANINDSKSNALMDGELGNAPESSAPSTGTGLFKRALSKDNRLPARRFFSAYAQTWIGMSPLWLMGEAVLPNKKVGTQFNKGRKNLVSAAEEVRQAVSTSGKDVVVIIDEKLRGSGEGGRQIAERTAEVIKAAGENAVLVVTTSLDKLSQLSPTKDGDKGKASSKAPQFNLNKLAHDPELKRTLKRHGRDALVLLDNGLKHPVVITGVSGFARTRGIPHADALLRLASLGLGKILRAMPEDIQEEVSEHVEAKIEEIDAEDLERRSTFEERQEAESIGQAAEKAPTPKVEGDVPNQDGGQTDPYAEMKKKNDCIVM